jgi:hypothetical protein
MREIFIVQNAAPGGKRLIGGKDHRALAFVPFVDDVEEHVRGVGAIGEVADFVDYQHVRMREAPKHLGEAPLAEGRGELVDQLGGGDEERLEAVLDRPVGDGHRKMGLAAAGFAEENEASALGHEVRRERRAKQRQAHGGLVGEVELVDRLEEREARPMREPREARVAALRDLLADESCQEVVEGPLLFLGACDEIAPHPAGVGKVQPLEQPVQVDVGGLHSASSCWRRFD